MVMKLLCRSSALAIPLRAGSVHCVVTSPPYWGLRDYGIAGQLGLERTPEEYVGNMVRVFREVRRVLRDDGTLWLNLGDSYASGEIGRHDGKERNGGGECFGKKDSTPRRQERLATGLKPKDLVGIPWRVAFALQADGWYLRSDIVWSKPNPMPESVRDRPTKAHEYLFLLSKRATYFYDAEAIKEATAYQVPDDAVPSGDYSDGSGRNDGNGQHRSGGFVTGTSRNRRSVWTVATQPYSGAHFATFPEKLVEPCILAGTSAKGCCPECGAPWERIVEVDRATPSTMAYRLEQRDDHPRMGPNLAGALTRPPAGAGSDPRRTVGWRPSCDHGKEPTPCRVLDPFAGTATAVRVANRLGRKGVGLDLNPKYLSLADDRTTNVQMELL